MKARILVVILLCFEQGFAIGNGLTNPAIQYKAYPDYALDMGIITKATRNRLNLLLVPACEAAIKLCGNLHIALSISVNCISCHVCMFGVRDIMDN